MLSLSEMLNNKKTVFIGSSPENDIVIKDAQASPVHCQISRVKKGVYLVVDLESATGTFINDKKVVKGFAGDYDTIKVGNNVFQLNDDTVSQSSEPPQQAFASVKQSATLPAETNVLQESHSSTAVDTQGASSTVHYIPGNHGTVKNKITVYFLSSPEDEAICKAIYKHLSTIQFSSPLPIEMLGDFKIMGGEEIAAYREKIADADIVLAFVSVDFLNNNDCYERLKLVIDNHNKRKTILLPILARNCMWKATPFANLPLLPKNHQPLNNKQYWNSEDDALTNVADDIYTSITAFTKNSTPEAPLSVTNTATLKVNWRKGYLWKNFWKRTAAYFLDALIIILPMFLVFYLVFGENFTSEVSGTPLFSSLIYIGLLTLVYSYFDSSKWRGTPGKHIMKLQITNDAGNPVSFDQALKRNAIKFFLFSFLTELDKSGVSSLLMCIAQIVCYATSRKFIHDYLSHTVIGERLISEAKPTGMQSSREGEQAPSSPVRNTSKKLAATTIGLIAIICIALFAVVKLAESNETGLTEEKKESLRTAIKYADATEIEALRTLNPDILSRAYTGEFLQLARTNIESLRDQGEIHDARLDDQQFLSFKVSSDEQEAEVKVVETWSRVIYSDYGQQCEGKELSHRVPQTIFLKQNNGVWMVYNILYESTTPAQRIPCY